MRRTRYPFVGTKTGRISSTGVNIQSLARSEPKSKYLISEDRILQISNDISEDMCSASRKELIEIVKYFRNQVDELWWRHIHFGETIGTTLMSAGIQILKQTTEKTEKAQKSGG